MIRWVIFDMDWLLIDSEPFWKESEKKVFAQVWIHLSHEMMNQTVWLKVIEVVEFWFSRFPWDESVFSKSNIARDIVDSMVYFLETEWKWKHGYQNVLDLVAWSGYKIWLNSASDYRLIETVLQRLGVREYFNIIHSGQDEPYWKPHPGGYLSAAKKLELHPTECLVFEDSLNGILSAKAARMKCIAVPEHENISNPKFAIADMIVPSLSEIDKNILTQF